jgi:hypothetical protein
MAPIEFMGGSLATILVIAVAAVIAISRVGY